jgi:glycosyltransferase involved in cell wall biosynthesis
MILSIVTINYNNAEGLRKTLASVATQTYRDIEHIIIDGGSTDESVDAIKDYVADNPKRESFFKHTVNWVSEHDNGIYNAMNKGIKKATGTYIQILNSGDIFAASDVVERMVAEIENAEYPELLYGNMIKKDYATGKTLGKSREVEYSLRQYYASTMNHDCCYIRRDLFDKYGLYDENLKIVSDWKWFLQAIGLGKVKPVYVDIDVTIFDASGISETNLELRNQERRQVLEEVLPPAVLADYEKHAFDAEQMDRLRRHHLYWLVYFIERVLFKLEKWGVLK